MIIKRSIFVLLIALSQVLYSTEITPNEMIITPSVQATEGITQNQHPTKDIAVKLSPPKPIKPTTHPYLMQENYRFPTRPQNRNIDLSVDGFYDVKLSGRDYSIKDINDPRWQTIINDPIYNKIPADVLLGSLRTEHRFKLQIDGQLNDDLSVHFDIEQEPDFPGKYDVKIKHKRKLMEFFHYDATFSNGSFINIKKALNGAHYYQESDNWRTQIAMGKQRSEPKKFTSYGNGQNTYNFANTFILPGSVTVWFNNDKQNEGSDYTINYTEGSLTFLNRSPQKNEQIKVVYEFTNPIADFIPVLSRKNFTGIDFHYKSKDQVITQKQTNTQLTTLWSEEIAKKSISKTNTETQQTERPSPTGNVLSTLKSLFDSIPTPDYLTPKTITSNIVTGNSTDPITDPTAWIDKVIPPQTFFLDNTPIILGSEKVRVNSILQNPNIDYFINHSSGKILFKSPLLATDLVDVRYDYYRTDHVIIDIIGKNSAGPYTLPHTHIIDNSSIIKLDNTTLRETFDYIINYDEGILFFNYKIPYPSIITVEYDAIQAQKVTRNVQKKPYEFSVSYMDESVRSPEEELILTAPSENITVSNNSIATRFTPIVSTSDITILDANNNLISSQNYTIKSEYKGQIEFSDSTINGTDIKIKYKYRKSFRAKFQSLVKIERLIFSNNEKDFYIIDLPVMFRGVEFIRYFNQKTGIEIILDEGIDFDIDYGENGESISLTFKTKTTSASGAKLNHAPKIGDRFIIEYQYTPDEALDPGDIKIEMVGMTFKTQLTDKWSISGELAGAKNNFSKPRVTLTDPVIVSGNGQDNHAYPLPNTALVEDSELVFLNNILQIKDEHYTINYVRGTVRFRDQTPQQHDQIKVFYDYFSTSSLTEQGEETGLKLATKIETSYLSDKIQTGFNVKHVDQKFLPIAPIGEKKGTLELNSHFNWKVNDTDSLRFNYKKIREDRGFRINEDDRYYLNNNTYNLNTKIKLFDAFDTNNTFRYNTAVEDKVDKNATGNAHAIDTQSWALNTNIGFGPQNLRTSLQRNFSRNTSDYIDKVSLSKTTAETYTYSLNSNTDHFPLLNKISFSPNYSTGKSSITTPSGTSFTKRNSHGYSSTITPIKPLVIGLNYNNQKLTTKQQETASKNSNIIINKSQTMTYSPANWFSAQYSQSLSESESPLLNQEGSVHFRKSYGIRQFSPYGFLMASGFSPFNPFIKTIKGSSASFSDQLNNSKENNARKISDSKNRSFSYTNFEPIRGFKLNSFRYHNSNSEVINKTESTTTAENDTMYDSEKYNYSISILRQLPVIRIFSYSYNRLYSSDTQENKTISHVSTSTITTQESPHLNETHQLKLIPLQLKIPIGQKKSFKLGSISAYASKTISNKEFVKQIYTSPISGLDDCLANIQNCEAGIPEEDTSRIKTTTIGSNLSPFNIFTLNGKLTNSDSELRRNFIQSQGTTLRKTKDYSLDGAYSPFRWLSLSGNYSHNTMSQFISPTLNITNENLMNEPFNASPDATFLSSYLNTLNRSASSKVTFTPFRFISFSGGGTKSYLKQRHLNTNESLTTSDTSTIFEQESGLGGIIFRPFTAIHLSLDANFMRTRVKNTTWKMGRRLVFRAVYTPIQTKYMNVNITFERVKTNGHDFNTLQNKSTLQRDGQSLSNDIIERNDYVDVGALNMEISIPLHQSPFIQEFKIIGEGHLKKIQDNNDKDRKEYNDSTRNSTDPFKLSYDLFGLVIKGSLIF